MAYVDGRWLDGETRRAEIKRVKENVRIYRDLFVAGELHDGDMDALEQEVELLERLERVERSSSDFLYFMYEYFSEDRNPGNPGNLIPEGQTLENAADFHVTLTSLLNDVTAGVFETSVAWSVGRNHAKTAYLSNGYLCYNVCMRLQKYVVLVSETVDVASDFIAWTSYQLKHNEKLRQDFGEQMQDRKMPGQVDNRNEFVTLTGVKVEAKGVQAQMRGLRHLDTRPGLFLLDDLESKANTNTPELRKKNKDWFREEMLPAMSKGGMCVYMGTIVHYDSLLNYTIKERRDFTSKIFPAILEWSKREDLWEQWRQIYREDADDAATRADAFYKAHEAEMIEGTRVLWEERFSYLDLMKIRENSGAKAFNQEYLGNPVDEETQVFKPEDFTYYTHGDLPDDLEYYLGVDFAMGKEKGDYSAVIVLGKSQNDVHYVVDTFVERVHPDVLLDKVVELTLEYQCDGLAVEAQQAQEWFADKVAQALYAAGYPARTRLQSIKQRNRKALRIESLLPDIQTGKIRFLKSQRLLLEMLELYPNHNHDDAPDALHMALSVARGLQVRVRRSRKRTH